MKQGDKMQKKFVELWRELARPIIKIDRKFMKKDARPMRFIPRSAG